MKNYSFTNHLGNVLAVVSDKIIPVDSNSDDETDYYLADIISSKDYAPFGGYLPGRDFSSESYPNSFNGKRDDSELGDWQDYGMRVYMKNARRFFSVDPLASRYAYLSTYQFASNSPIDGVDLDGLEHYYSASGKYLGAPPNNTNQDVRIVSDEIAKKYENNVSQIHDGVENKCNIQYNTLPVYEYDTKTKMGYTRAMQQNELLDQAQIIYGEERGKQSDNFAHTILNGEIKAYNRIKWFSTHAKGVDQKTGEKIPHDETNSDALADFKETGNIFNYNLKLIGAPRPWSVTDGVLHKGEPANEWDKKGNKLAVINKGYEDFFKYKGDMAALIKNIPITEKIIKSIIDARLSKTTDPCPNCDSWKGSNGKNTFYNGRTDQASGKSDEEKK